MNDLTQQQRDTLYAALNRDGFDNLIADETFAVVAQMLTEAAEAHREQIARVIESWADPDDPQGELFYAADLVRENNIGPEGTSR